MAPHWKRHERTQALADPNANAGFSGAIDHFKAALGHALDAVRCFIAMLAADAEQRAVRLVDGLAWLLVWVGLGLTGLVFFAVGLSELLDSAIGRYAPGAARMAVGLALVGSFLVVHVVRRRSRGSK
jgi:hypothetical protein